MTGEFLETLYAIRHSPGYTRSMLPHMPPNREGIELYYNEARVGIRALLDQLAEAYTALLGPDSPDIPGLDKEHLKTLPHFNLLAQYDNVKRGSHWERISKVAVSKSKLSIEHHTGVNAKQIRVLTVSERELEEFEPWLVDVRRRFDAELDKSIRAGACGRCSRARLYKKYIKEIDDTIAGIASE